VIEGDETFAQVLTPTGRIVERAGGARAPALSATRLRAALRGPIQLERTVPGIEGTARVLARPQVGPDGRRVVVVGQSLADRDATLARLRDAFLVGGPIAVLIASLVGYGLATAGLAPVEAMRRRAAELSWSGEPERLPLPSARDEVHRLGATLNDMLERLRRAFERERRFVADASHELRTPIAVLKTELEGALRGGGFGAETRAALTAAVEECDRLGQLAEDLLLLARSAEGVLPVRPEPLDARTLLEGARQRFADRAARKGRRIDVDAPADVVVWGDPLRLRQALGNVADNALRHGAGTIRLSACATDGGVELDVTDEGTGFDPALGGQAFDRFARGPTARSDGGAGLGLAIVRAIAEAHGGEASIAAGGCTTVRMRLPGRPPQGPLSHAA
jgi:two-component system, OmpR family, sensor kinase